MPGSGVPLNLSVAATLFKSSLHAPDGFVPLVKVTWPDGSLLRLARNTDDLLFDAGDGAGAQPYTAFSWDFAELDEKADGSLPTWAVKVSNVGRMVESLTEQYGGGVGGSLTVYVVQLSRLKREPELELDFDITGSMSDSHWVSFTLGAESFLRIIFGRHTYTSDSCRHKYKGSRCQYAGPLPSCSFSLGGPNGCRAHGNTLHFGAYPGIDSNGLRAVVK